MAAPSASVPQLLPQLLRLLVRRGLLRLRRGRVDERDGVRLGDAAHHEHVRVLAQQGQQPAEPHAHRRERLDAHARRSVLASSTALSWCCAALRMSRASSTTPLQLSQPAHAHAVLPKLLLLLLLLLLLHRAQRPPLSLLPRLRDDME